MRKVGSFSFKAAMWFRRWFRLRREESAIDYWEIYKSTNFRKNDLVVFCYSCIREKFLEFFEKVKQFHIVQKVFCDSLTSHKTNNKLTNWRTQSATQLFLVSPRKETHCRDLNVVSLHCVIFRTHKLFCVTSLRNSGSKRARKVSNVYKLKKN